MTKDELVALVEHVNACWNRSLPREDVKAMNRAWWELCGDLDETKTRAVINELALTAPYTPRPGEVRRLVLMPGLPSPIELWAELQAISRMMHTGSDQGRKPMSPTLKLIYHRMGDTLMGLVTNGDRNAFINVAETVINEQIKETCLKNGLAPHAENRG